MIPARRANAVVILLAAAYVVWQYALPIVVFVIPSLERFGVGLGFALVIMVFTVQARDIAGGGARVFVWALALCMIGTLSALVAGGSAIPHAIPFIWSIGTLASIYAVFVIVGRCPNSIKIIVAVLVVMALVNAAVAIWGTFTGRTLFAAQRIDVGAGALGYDSTTGRSGGLRGENYATTWIAPGLAVGLLLLFRRPYNPKGIFIAAMSALGIIVSLSRTAIMSAGILFIVALFISMKRGLKVLRLALLIGILTGGLYVGKAMMRRQAESFTAVVKAAQTERWTSIDQAISSRLGVWKSATDLGSRSLLLGRGPGAIDRELAIVSHNSLLDAIVELGIIGMLVLFLPVFQTLWFFVRHSKVVANDEYLAILFVAASGMFATWMTLSSMYLKIIWIIPAMIQGRLLYLRDVEAMQGALYAANAAPNPVGWRVSSGGRM